MKQKKRVLLVLPPDVTAIEPFCSARKKHAPLVLGFPLGLGYIASYLLREGMYEVKIIDGIKDKLSVSDIIKIISDFDPHYIGITIYTIISKVAVQLAKEIKIEFKDKVVIAGGPHASDDYQNLLTKYPFFDYIIIGEGEVTMSELLKVLDSGNFLKVKDVKGIAYVESYNGDLVFTGNRPFIRNIDHFPAPTRELLNFDSYIIRGNLLPYAVEVMGSRGCTHRCAFCSFQKSWRPRHPEEIVKEMQDLIKQYPKIRSFLFFDDSFSSDKKRVIELCQVLIREGLNKYMWSCLCRVDQVSKEMLVWMKKAGCTKISFGVESADPEILRNLNKMIKPEQVKYAVELATKVGIDVLAFFIIGSPGETEETIKTSYNFAKKLKCQSTVWGVMQVYPGTTLAKIQPCDDFVAYLYKPEIENPVDAISANVPIFENPGLDRETTKSICKKIFREIVIYKALHHPFFTIKKILRAPVQAFRFLFSLLRQES